MTTTTQPATGPPGDPHGPCAERGCIRTLHPQNPDCHVKRHAWHPDRHDRNEP